MQQVDIGILGATGMVGQRFLELLANHPWFNVTWLAASDRSSGKPYGEAVRWKLSTPLPERYAAMPLSPAVPDEHTPRVIFAALDTDIALELEPRFANAGCAVISNSAAFRMEAHTPLVIPEVNEGHLSMVRHQSWADGGYVVTNPNCSAIGLVLALKPLEATFGIESLFVTTMQAISGAGYPGVASLDILGNVVPFIRNEEEKMVAETAKLLGGVSDAGESLPLALRMTAHCNRVAVEDGHTESVSIKLRKPATAEQILECWQQFRPLSGRGLPSAPEQPVEYLHAEDRPQPRLDRMRGGGMASVVGRLRPCTLLDWKFTVLSHNTIRGAAGAALLNAELLHQQGRLVPDRAARGAR
ncbi:aspartate-semialdehyde dehydrogenase [Acidipila sp. EB88]|uniref:aspartate-semialdehyde dehydrogenase n=1 Tax=Acidipila sp. EB88 TaxID=2305226 RepID=UPI000F5E4394|nr:aspartate-semialdehyde dehydrogenase [Acidipila sp. EB88]RRA48808.1 aspartate-semialdehyde dehydrogenase [Acidipila sp. EB88]